MQTHYDVLGVSWKANDDQIRAAFRRSVKACHPDLHAGDRNAERKLREVLAAYEILRKPQRKVIYDRLLRAERSARAQRFVLTAFTGLVCCSVIGGMTLWLPRLPTASNLVAAVAAPPETARVAVADVSYHMPDPVVRPEVNSSSKGDRVASAPIRPTLATDS